MMRRRRKEAVTAAIVVGIIAAIVILACALYDVAYGAKVGGEWVNLGPFSGGINTSSNRGQLSPSQFVVSSNFVWSLDAETGSDGSGNSVTGMLEVREGFYRFAEPVTGNGVKFIDLFKSVTGSSYLFYSDGSNLWYRTNLTEASVSLDFGRANSGTVDTYSGSVFIHGNTIASQKLRTLFGPGDSLTMTINGAPYLVKRILLDTLVELYDAFGSTESATSYNMDLASLSVNSAFQVSNNYWVFTNVGKFRFERPGSFVIIDSLTGTRYAYTEALRTCLGSVPTMRFAASGITENYTGKFARIVTNPLSEGTPANPVTVNHAMYMALPVYSSSGGFLYTLGAAFGPLDSTAQYVTITDLAIDTTTKRTVVVDSVQVLVSDSTGFACSGNYNLYLKLFCDTCEWQDDSMMFASGDHFIAPSTRTTEIGDLFASGLNTSPHNTIIATKVTTPNQAAVKAYRVTVEGHSTATSGNPTQSFKAAIYRADTTLVDTSRTLATVATNNSFATMTFSFAEGVDLVGNTDYFVALWGDSTGFGCYYGSGPGAWSITDDYDGSFPATVTGATRYTSRDYSMTVDIDYYDQAAPMLTSALNCLPIVGGYMESDSTILVAVASTTPGARGDLSKIWNRMKDSDTSKIAFFRMKRSATQSAEGIEWAAWHNSVSMEVRSLYKDRIYWSEVNNPDSFLSDHSIIVDHGNPLIVGGPQGGNFVVYTPTNRWAIIYGGGGIYGKQYLDGARGCIARSSFVNIDGVHYGLAADGYWETSGEAPRLISGAVSSYFTDSLDMGRLDDIAAGYDAENDNIWFSQKDNFTLVYNRGSGSWWPQSWEAGAYHYNADITVSDSIGFIAGGTDSSTLYVRGGTNDDGDSIVAVMQTGWLDYGISQLIKNVKGLRLGYETEAVTNWTCESFGQNYATGATYSIGSFTGSTVAGWSEQQMRFAQGWYRGKRLSHKLTFYDASGLKLPYLQALVKMGQEE